MGRTQVKAKHELRQDVQSTSLLLWQEHNGQGSRQEIRIQVWFPRWVIANRIWNPRNCVFRHCSSPAATDCHSPSGLLQFTRDGQNRSGLLLLDQCQLSISKYCCRIQCEFEWFSVTVSQVAPFRMAARYSTHLWTILHSAPPELRIISRPPVPSLSTDSPSSFSFSPTFCSERDPNFFSLSLYPISTF